MSDVKLVHFKARSVESLVAEIMQLTEPERVDVVWPVLAKTVMEAPGKVEGLDSALAFLKDLKVAFKDESERLPIPDPKVADLVAATLAQPGLTGPERALLAAAKLYHRGVAVVNARQVNSANDEDKGGYIPNISMAIASNTRSKFLTELEADGHSSYALTLRGFRELDNLLAKTQKTTRTSAG